MNFSAIEIGARLAQYPVEVWLVGLCLSFPLALGALAGLRALQRARPPLRRHLPAHAHWRLLAALVGAAGLLLLGGFALAQLAESGRSQGYWGALDDALVAGLRIHASTTVLRWFSILTHLGDAWALTVLCAVVTVALWLRQHRLLAITWLLALAGNGALTRILKSLFERVRPEHLHGIARADGYSFPSGHSSASMVAWTMLAYLATRLLPRAWHAPAAVLGGAFIVTTGWSRVVLQVHYASDVLAGWLLGMTWMVCTVLVVESVGRWQSRPTEPRQI